MEFRQDIEHFILGDDVNVSSARGEGTIQHSKESGLRDTMPYL